MSEKIVKRLHTIDTFFCTDDETILKGKDEHGNPFKLVVDTIELLEWLDIPHMKNKLKQHIDTL